MHLKSVITSLLALGVTTSSIAAEFQEESQIKFAFYSSAWGENTDDGLRLVAFNQTSNHIRIESITFLKDDAETENVYLEIDLEVPAGKYADAEYDYINLTAGDECIERTMLENWKLV